MIHIPLLKVVGKPHHLDKDSHRKGFDISYPLEGSAAEFLLPPHVCRLCPHRKDEVSSMLERVLSLE